MELLLAIYVPWVLLAIVLVIVIAKGTQCKVLPFFIGATLLLIVIRCGAFGFLMYTEATGRQSLSYLPLVFLLYPEGALFSSDHGWTVWNSLGAVMLLMAGSAFMGLLLTAVMAAIRRLGRGSPS